VTSELAVSRHTLSFIVSNKDATLLTPEQQPFTVGAAPYYDSAEPTLVDTEPRIFIRVEPAHLGIDVLAMVDTGAPWCIFEPRIGSAIRDRLEELPGNYSLSTRLGRFEGKLYLGTVTILAREGEALDVEATIFLSPDWPSGNFVGYLGFLARICSGLNPLENTFYFGPLVSGDT
jgi:hypothetical protein